MELKKLLEGILIGTLLATLLGPDSPSAFGRNQTSLNRRFSLHENPKLCVPPPMPAGSSSDWWAKVQSNIRRSEYQVTWQKKTYLTDVPAAYQAPNRANNLRIYFTAEKTVIIPRVWKKNVEALPWRVELGQAVLDQQINAGPLPLFHGPRVEGNRIEYGGRNPVTWYRNDENGLDQGYTIGKVEKEKNAVESPSVIRLQMTIASELTPRCNRNERVIEFWDRDERPVLCYRAVPAEDNRGRKLPTRIALSDSQIILTIDDTAALYPIQVQASIGSLPDGWNWKEEINQADAEFGKAVFTAGDVNGDGYSDVIVGAPSFDGGQIDEGRAYVYQGSPSGLNTNPNWVKESDQGGARFGTAVATAGDVNGDGYADVIVGAPNYTNGQADEGGAWVYHGSASGLNHTAATHEEGNQSGARFGSAVGTAGDLNGDGYSDVIVGAPGYTNGESSEGRVYVWHGSASGLETPHSWHAEGNQAGAQLGRSVGTAGDVNGDGYGDIIVGAPYWGDGGLSNEGKVWVYLGSPLGLGAVAAWSRESGSNNAYYGYAVAMAGDVNGDGYADIIVGAPYYTNGQADEGGTWVYHGSASGLNNIAATHDEGNQAGARFGMALGTAGDVNGDGYADVIVGAPGYTNGESGEGRVWVWHGSASGLSATHDWRGEGNQADAQFGMAVFTAGDVNGDGYSDVIIGAPGYTNGQTYEGAAYVFYGSPSSLNSETVWTKRSNQANAFFGWSVATAGDVNGDGYDDIIVGAYGWDGGQINEGGVWVYHGSAKGVVSAPAWYKQSDQADAWFGYSVGTAGDVNGDGYADVIVGAPYWHSGQTDEGGAWVYSGSASGVVSTPAWYKQSDKVDARFGWSVGTAGDVNGDGYSDIIVGSPYYDHPEDEEGLAAVYHGSSNGLSSAPAWFGQGDFVGAHYGWSVGTAGDVNGDGYSDIIVGSPRWAGDALNEGRAWVYHGSASGLETTHSWHAEGNQAGARLGRSVGTAGDVNGDGYSDIIVGAPYWGDGGLSNEGKVWVYHGSPLGLGAVAAWSRESGSNNAYYGYAVNTAGDVNGDGYADIILGAPSQSGSVTGEGTTRVYLGSASGLRTSYDWRGEGGQTGGWYGHSVSTAGDVNGDGYADVLVGQYGYSEAQVSEGRVYVYYGNASIGTSLRLRQARFGSSIPIAPLGRSDSLNGLRIYVDLRTPFGRGLIQPEFEIKPIGTPFNGANTIWWGYWDDVLPGSTRYTSFSTLRAGVPYHWRVRIRYNPVSTPFMPGSRWFTRPWNGWNETDFRTVGQQLLLPVILNQ